MEMPDKKSSKMRAKEELPVLLPMMISMNQMAVNGIIHWVQKMIR